MLNIKNRLSPIVRKGNILLVRVWFAFLPLSMKTALINSAKMDSYRSRQIVDIGSIEKVNLQNIDKNSEQISSEFSKSKMRTSVTIRLLH